MELVVASLVPSSGERLPRRRYDDDRSVLLMSMIHVVRPGVHVGRAHVRVETEVSLVVPSSDLRPGAHLNVTLLVVTVVGVVSERVHAGTGDIRVEAQVRGLIELAGLAVDEGDRTLLVWKERETKRENAANEKLSCQTCCLDRVQVCAVD